MIRVAAAVASIACCLGLAACATPGDPPVAAAEQPDGSAASGDVWPLTGLPVAEGRRSDQRHPVFLVKIDNTARAGERAGLDRADAVFELLVEGGQSRLGAMFFSELPVAGPVRSVRTTDVPIAGAVDGVVVASGGAPIPEAALLEEGIDLIDENDAALSRDPARRAPYNVVVDLKELAASYADESRERPDDLLTWGEGDALAGASPSSSVEVQVGSQLSTWDHTGEEYRRTPDLGFDADTVLLLTVLRGDAGYRDSSGSAVPETRLIGEGAAELHHGGEVVNGTWRKSAVDDGIWLADASGADLAVPPGRVFVALVSD